MSDRDRLIELMKYKRFLETSELADYLLANGVFLLPEDLRGTEDFSVSAFIEAMKMHKEKDRYIKLPCKVGDYVWLVFTPKYPANPNDYGKWFMSADGVQRIIYGKKGLSIETWSMGTILAKELGKKIFLTKEEAEKELKKRGKENE